MLKDLEESLTERINIITDKIASGNLDSESKSLLVNKHQEVWKERQELRKKIEELECNKG